jgi:hypothetical protein
MTRFSDPALYADMDREADAQANTEPFLLEREAREARERFDRTHDAYVGEYSATDAEREGWGDEDDSC